MESHRFLEFVEQSLGPSFGAEALGSGVLRLGQLPVTHQSRAAVFKNQQMGGRELLDLGEERAVSADEAIEKEVSEGGGIGLATDLAGLEDRLLLRSEIEASVRRQNIMQRFDAHPISGQNQAPPGGIPQGQGKHSAEVLHKPEFELFVKVGRHLGVASRREPMSPAFQRVRKLQVIVDFAVTDQGDGSVFVVERLFSGVQIDDAESSNSEADFPFDMNTVAVGAAVGEGRFHLRQEATLDRRFAFPACKPANSAHDVRFRQPPYCAIVPVRPIQSDPPREALPGKAPRSLWPPAGCSPKLFPNMDGCREIGSPGWRIG